MTFEYVKIIRRIIALKAGYEKACDLACRLDSEQGFDIAFKIEDKMEMLRQQANGWIYEGENASIMMCRRRQIELACKYLGVSYYTIHY